MKDFIVVGGVADNPFVEDIAQYLEQAEDYSDLISLKNFLNTEFCPRFIVENGDEIGRRLNGKTILLVSTDVLEYTRDELSMRNFLIGRAAKDNGAKEVVLLEPDLFYSAQDRGPKEEHYLGKGTRSLDDRKKFDGQPFSSHLYADLLGHSGFDRVVTVHNHSRSVKNLFTEHFPRGFHNLQPAPVYASYMRDCDIVDIDNLVLCSPDKGALPFVEEVHEAVGADHVPVITMDKIRKNEREVTVRVSPDSAIGLPDIEGKDVAVIDDMVRTGNTVVECCRLLKTGKPRKVVFFVTHFYSSREGRINLNDPAIDEIVTTSTIPQILNRDVQGRLRHKMVVLRIARWVSDYIMRMLDPESPGIKGPLYREDMSSKNPRWRGAMGAQFSKRE